MPRKTKLNPAQRARRLELGGERRAKTRSLILAAAYRLFATHGRDAPTIDDVVAEAQVARGTFYNHFDTRDDLFSAVADDIAHAINKIIRMAIVGESDPAAQISMSFRLFVHFAISDPTRGWILLRTMPLVRYLNQEMKQTMTTQFSRAIKGGQFVVGSLPIAMDLGMGQLIMTINRALIEGVNDDYINETAAAFLACMGMDKKSAARLARIPIDFEHLPSPAPASATPSSSKPERRPMNTSRTAVGK